MPESLFLINFIKKKTLAQVFPCEFCKIFKNTFFRKHILATASESPMTTMKKIFFNQNSFTFKLFSGFLILSKWKKEKKVKIVSNFLINCFHLCSQVSLLFVKLNKELVHHLLTFTLFFVRTIKSRLLPVALNISFISDWDVLPFFLNLCILCCGSYEKQTLRKKERINHNQCEEKKYHIWLNQMETCGHVFDAFLNQFHSCHQTPLLTSLTHLLSLSKK